MKENLAAVEVIQHINDEIRHKMDKALGEGITAMDKSVAEATANRKAIEDLEGVLGGSIDAVCSAPSQRLLWKLPLLVAESIFNMYGHVAKTMQI